MVDCKSIYDCVHKEGPGGSQDKRLEIELKILKEAMITQEIELRWMEGKEMPVDCMTKIGAPKEELLRMLKEKAWCLISESQRMAKRSLARQTSKAR